jgi:hypothetical protein
MMDTAQRLQGTVNIVPNGKYTTAAAINAARSRPDISAYVKERALIIIANETTTAATTLTLQHSNTVGGALTNIPAAAITDPETGDAITLADLAADQYQLVALNLELCKRFITVTAAVDPTTANGAAITVQFAGMKTRL